MAHFLPNPTNPMVRISHPPFSSPEEEAEWVARIEADARARRELGAEPSKGGKLTDINAPTPIKPSLPLPKRFQKPEIWSDSSQRQHPLYRTSAHEIGKRPPAIQEMPQKYYGNSHTFTNTFAGGMARDFGLNTSVTKNRVGLNQDFGYY